VQLVYVGNRPITARLMAITAVWVRREGDVTSPATATEDASLCAAAGDMYRRFAGCSRGVVVNITGVAMSVARHASASTTTALASKRKCPYSDKINYEIYASQGFS